jgi:hypothetical protein
MSMINWRSFQTFDPSAELVRILRQRRSRRRNLTPFKYTDAGRLYGEKRDCTVRALAIAADIPYSEAHALMALEGRRPKCGMYGFNVESALKNLPTLFEDIKITKLTLINRQAADGLFNGEELERSADTRNYHVSRWRNITLKMLLTKLSGGRYYVLGRAHAFAIVDGVVHDIRQLGGHTRIDAVWRIEKSSSLTRPLLQV